MIRTKRIHDPVEPADGGRYLVDGMWPRGIRRADAKLDGWIRAVAPSRELRRWFGHDPARWEAFRDRYAEELDATPETWRPLLEAARAGDVTLLYAARDREHNNAVALKAYLERRLAAEARGAGAPVDTNEPGP